ncbi:MAG: hypothetical protein V4733_10330 [Verrucomicrobiota bacterium]
MKAIEYLKSEEAPADFLREKLYSEGYRKMFPRAPFETKRSLVLNYLIGAETERFAAQPVYGPTGKGFLKSKGVDGLIAEKNLEKELCSVSGGSIVRQFVRRVERLITA